MTRIEAEIPQSYAGKSVSCMPDVEIAEHDGYAHDALPTYNPDEPTNSAVGHMSDTDLAQTVLDADCGHRQFHNENNLMASDRPTVPLDDPTSQYPRREIRVYENDPFNRTIGTTRIQDTEQKITQTRAVQVVQRLHEDTAESSFGTLKQAQSPKQDLPISHLSEARIRVDAADVTSPSLDTTLKAAGGTSLPKRNMRDIYRRRGATQERGSRKNGGFFLERTPGELDEYREGGSPLAQPAHEAEAYQTAPAETPIAA